MLNKKEKSQTSLSREPDIEILKQINPHSEHTRAYSKVSNEVEIIEEVEAIDEIL